MDDYFGLLMILQSKCYGLRLILINFFNNNIRILISDDLEGIEYE